MPTLPPLHLMVDVLVFAILPAALGTALVMAAVEYLGGTKCMSLGAALGLAAGTGVGLWWRGALTLGPDTSWNRLPWLALAALALGLATRPLKWVHWIVLIVASAGAAWWVLPVASRSEAPWLVPALAALTAALWGLLEYLAARPAGAGIPLIVAMAFFTAAGVLIHAGTARLTDAAVVTSASLAAVGAIAWLRGGDAGGAVPAAAVFLPGLLLMGQQETYSDVPWPAFVLPAVAPLTVVLTLPLRSWPGLRLHLLQFALVLIPLAIALGLALATGPLQYE